MEYDVVIVGAGPAGLSAAIRLKQLSDDVSVCVLEKGSEVGAHIVSGNVFEPRALDELLPEWREDASCPIRTPVAEDRFYYLTESRSVALPTPPVLDNHGNYVTSLSQVARWLGAKAEDLGVEIYPGFAASEVLYDEEEGGASSSDRDRDRVLRVAGVATRDVGRNKDGSPKETFEAGVELRGRQTLFAEGARGSCTEALLAKVGSGGGGGRPVPQTYGLGVKEVWRVADLKPGLVQHTIGWPLDWATYGGSFLYHGSDHVHVGFVVGLDYANPTLSPYKEFQRFKHHPRIAAHLRGGECVGYGARVINEGGYQAVPTKLAVEGACILGCAAGFLNVPKIKGTHTAMKSGILAAEATIDALRRDAPTSDYDERLRSSWVYDELRAVRNYKPSFEPFGLPGGLVYSGLSAYVLKGREPWTFGGEGSGSGKRTDSEATSKTVKDPIAYPKPDGVLSFPLLDNLARAGVDHADQPSHLKVKPEFDGVVTGKTAKSLTDYGGPEQHFCPAGVYEYVDDDDGDPNLVINAQNCVHCKCCAIKTPFEYIDWQVPEGGGGPNYQLT